MNHYQVALSHPDGSVATFTVASNNIPFAVQKAIKEAILSTRKTGWKYVSHRLIKTQI